ncbi:AAA family ATPase, partial [Candidatus Peregrinibacteria bacterium]|nr:AAA family ATPase [Candidatus Peregrinibacteria bacterium]
MTIIASPEIEETDESAVRSRLNGKEDGNLDNTLRPQSFDEYIGQDKIKKNLDILIRAAKKRQEPIEHILLYGPAGLGKTTLANIIAKEMGVNIRTTSGPAIERV